MLKQTWKSVKTSVSEIIHAKTSVNENYSIITMQIPSRERQLYKNWHAWSDLTLRLPQCPAVAPGLKIPPNPFPQLMLKVNFWQALGSSNPMGTDFWLDIIFLLSTAVEPLLRMRSVWLLRRTSQLTASPLPGIISEDFLLLPPPNKLTDQKDLAAKIQGGTVNGKGFVDTCTANN